MKKTKYNPQINCLHFFHFSVTVTVVNPFQQKYICPMKKGQNSIQFNSPNFNKEKLTKNLHVNKCYFTLKSTD